MYAFLQNENLSTIFTADPTGRKICVRIPPGKFLCFWLLILIVFLISNTYNYQEDLL